jgi:hypothetical protein
MLVADTARCAAMSADDFTDSRGRFAGIGEWWLEGRCSLRGRCALGEGRCSGRDIAASRPAPPSGLSRSAAWPAAPRSVESRSRAQSPARPDRGQERRNPRPPRIRDVLGAFRPPLAHRYSFAPFYTHIPNGSTDGKLVERDSRPPLDFPLCRDTDAGY